MTAIVPPSNSGLPVFLHAAFALHEQKELCPQLLAGYPVGLEDVEQVGRREAQALIQQVLDIAFLIPLHFPRVEDFVQNLMIFIHSSHG